jgi:hypothetical protein
MSFISNRISYQTYPKKSRFLTLSRSFFGHNARKKADLAADYRFFDTPQPLSPSENQVFQQLLALSSSGRDKIRNPGLL